MKVLIVGDTHADLSAPARIFQAAREYEVQEIWQVGDFGYWPNNRAAQEFLRRMTSEAIGTGIKVYFADGNHEDHESLRHNLTEPYNVGGYRGAVYHVPRGHIRTIRWPSCTCPPPWDACSHSPNEIRVMFFGGAVSVDKIYRTAGFSWFHNEVPNQQEWDRMMEAGEADVVVAHDVPLEVDFGYPPHSHAYWPVEQLIESDAFRKAISEVMLPQVKPRLWFGGHHHRRVIADIGELTVHVMGESTQPLHNWLAVYDLSDGTVKAVSAEELKTPIIV